MILRRLIGCIFAGFLACTLFFGATSVAHADTCTSNQIDVLGNGTKCETTKFSLTTTNLSANNTFQFSLSAKGTFYVDCGDGGTLNSGTGVSGKTITRSNTTKTTYTCKYSNAGEHTIKFGGGASVTTSSYNTNTRTAAISFYQSSNNPATKIASISGNLSSMFPYITANATNKAQPRFYQTFYGATNLKSISDTLFADYTNASTYMFSGTFQKCSNLAGYIQPTTFKGLIEAGSPKVTGMFYDTFTGTKMLTSCPCGTKKFTTGYEGTTTNSFYLGGKVSCEPNFDADWSSCKTCDAGTTQVITPGVGVDCAVPSVSGITLDTTGADTGATPSPVYLKYNTGWYSDSSTTNAITQLTTVPTKSGKGFIGFYTGENGTGSKIVDENGNLLATYAGLRFTDTATTLYAHFGDVINVTYACGDGATGTPPAQGTVITGTSFTPAANTCTKDGYIFGGWGVSGTDDVVSAPFTWNYSDDKTLTAEWFKPKFTLTTTNTTNSFSFSLSSMGTFYVDWGDGTVERIVRDNTTNTTYTHNYSGAGAYTINFGGGATDTTTSYSAFTSTAAISFYQSSNNSAAKIASVSGNLSSMFPYITANAADGAQPRFYQTFRGATNLTSIPNTLFADYTSASTYMFYYTFGSCTHLTSIPENLFFPNATSVTGANYMFYYTFYGCAGLTSIPENLFSKITTSASNMFYYTFYGCTGLTSIPEKLFFPNATSVTGASGMFRATFSSCRGLTSIPGNLFSKITTSASYMFDSTFTGCTGLKSIPENLFFPNATSVTGAERMFNSTFSSCTGLTSIPGNLFSKVTTSAAAMFNDTFGGCTRLTSIPENLFSKITTSASYMFSYTFQNCTGLTSIPENLFFPNATSVTGASYMFSNTFGGCTGLTSIPENLFFPNATSVTGESSMFYYTFQNCTGLTSIPENLFSKITTPASSMFQSTFQNCSNLAGYIPPTTFAGLTAAGAPTASSMFYYTFNGTNLSTSCPCGTKQFITGYEGEATNSYYLGGKVSCEPNFDADWSSCKTCDAGTTQVITPGVGVDCAVPSVSEITLDTTGADTGATPSTVYLKYNTGWYSDSSATNAITQLTTVPTKSGKVFTGFYTGENGTGTQVVDKNGNLLATNAGLRFADTATTVYAHFGDEINVTYACGDGATGTPPAQETVITGTSFTPAANTCTKNGYTFIGWGVSGTDDVVSAPFTWNYSGDKTLTAQWFETKFTLTTTNTTNSFRFSLSAKGTFYVDWGDGTVEKIVRDNTTNTTYTHNYSGAGAYTINFGGGATDTTTSYNTGTTTAAISFYQFSNNSAAKIASVSGNLSSMFPYITANAADGAQPRFYQTFYGATNLTSIPDTLFADYTSASSQMFYYTFSGCTGLTSIPENLFFPNATSVTGAKSMFNYTFGGCTGLTSIPENLFSKITTAASDMFNHTFYGCTGLTSIPENLFFPNATSVTGANYMFYYTFSGCTGLTSIPENLFSKITIPALEMFSYTFQSCSNLAGYIPPTTFKGLIDAGSPTSSFMFYYTFDGTNLSTSCPCGTKQFITGYEGASYTSYYLGGKVSCEPDFDADWSSCKTCDAGTTQVITPGVGVDCAVPSVSEITLDTTGADTGATPSTVYLKYNTGWYSDSSATNAITQLTTVPTKSGKVFTGFYTGENGTGSKVIDENGNLLATNVGLRFADTATTVYAHFGDEYSITYMMNDGTNYNGVPTVYIEGTGVTIDGVPTKAGSTFAGWCTDEQLQNCSMTQTIGTDATGDKTFWAKWTECTACSATNATCSLSVVNNVCTYTTTCNTGYGDIQNNGQYNAICTKCQNATYLNNGVCTQCPTGYDANTTEGKTEITQCQIHCNGGSYISTANDIVCTDAGVGYWTAESNINYGSVGTLTACATGLTTIGYGHGADEENDCGRKLHLNNSVFYTRRNKVTTPSLNFMTENGDVFYLSLSTTNHNLSRLHASYQGIEYTAYDDSLLYTEREFD